MLCRRGFSRTAVGASTFTTWRSLQATSWLAVTRANKRKCSSRPEPAQSKSLLDIGTRRIFEDYHDEFRSSVRKFFEKEVVPYHSQWEEDGEVSRELWLKAGGSGLLGLTTPEEYGGAGADVLSSAIVWEEQSYCNCTGPGFSLHSDIVMPYICNYGTKEQKEKYLPKLASGEWIGAIAMTEPGTGSDLAGVSTTAKKDGSDYLINGSKTFITNGAMADVVIVVTKTDASKGAHGVSLFLVERGMKGFERGRKLKKMGLKAQDTSELFFDSVRVSKDHLLGKENHGFYYLMQELPQERLLIADMAQASMEACFEMTRKYVKERKAFGQSISQFQTIQHRLAELKTEISVGRAFSDQCLQLHKEKRLDASMASMCKYWITDLQGKVIDSCVQLHGGWGYMWEYGVCKAYVDARVQRIYGGTNEIMKELIARTI